MSRFYIVAIFGIETNVQHSLLSTAVFKFGQLPKLFDVNFGTLSFVHRFLAKMHHSLHLTFFYPASNLRAHFFMYKKGINVKVQNRILIEIHTEHPYRDPLVVPNQTLVPGLGQVWFLNRLALQTMPNIHLTHRYPRQKNKASFSSTKQLITYLYSSRNWASGLFSIRVIYAQNRQWETWEKEDLAAPRKEYKTRPQNV